MKKQIIYYIIIALGILSIIWCFYSQKTNTAIMPEQNQVIVPQTKTSIEKTLATTTQEQSGVIDEHLTINNELRDVNFCGKTYKVKQVLIDGVDVVQRVAELATQNIRIKEFPTYEGTGQICKRITQGYSANADLHATGHGAGETYKKEVVYATTIYIKGFGTLQFEVSPTKNILYQFIDDDAGLGMRIPISSFK